MTIEKVIIFKDNSDNEIEKFLTPDQWFTRVYCEVLDVKYGFILQAEEEDEEEFSVEELKDGICVYLSKILKIDDILEIHEVKKYKQV